MKIEKILMYLERAERDYKFWTDAKAVYDQCQSKELGEYPLSAFIAYIKTGTTEDAAKMLNEAGQRTAGARVDTERKFQPQDISDTITNVDIEDSVLMEMARSLLNSGREYISRLH